MVGHGVGEPGRHPSHSGTSRKVSTMSERVTELLRTMVAGDLESEIRDAAEHAGVQHVEPEDLRHLVRVMTSYSLVVTSLSDLIKFTDLLDAQVPHVLGMLATSSP